MSIISIIVSLVVTGVILWAVNAYVPMNPTIKKIVNILVVILLIGWLLSIFGVFNFGS